MGNNHRGYQGNNYKGFKSQDSAVPSNVPNKNIAQKITLKMLGVWRETLL